MLPWRAASHDCFSCSESAWRTQHLARAHTHTHMKTGSPHQEAVQASLLLLDRQQLEAEAALQRVQRPEATQAQVLEQNHVLVLQPNTSFLWVCTRVPTERRLEAPPTWTRFLYRS